MNVHIAVDVLINSIQILEVREKKGLSLDKIFYESSKIAWMIVWISVKKDVMKGNSSDYTKFKNKRGDNSIKLFN